MAKPCADSADNLLTLRQRILEATCSALCCRGKHIAYNDISILKQLSFHRSFPGSMQYETLLCNGMRTVLHGSQLLAEVLLSGYLRERPYLVGVKLCYHVPEVTLCVVVLLACKSQRNKVQLDVPVPACLYIALQRGVEEPG